MIKFKLRGRSGTRLFFGAPVFLTLVILEVALTMVEDHANWCVRWCYDSAEEISGWMNQRKRK